MQARLYNRSTRTLFEEAGISAGMRVLDLGSGARDVALLIGDMVGLHGSVLGIDSNPAILETARRRPQAAGATQVSVSRSGRSRMRPGWESNPAALQIPQRSTGLQPAGSASFLNRP
jgi:tRNA A58 N-methylase Trm61